MEDFSEIESAAHMARAAGFPQVMIDTDHIIAIFAKMKSLQARLDRDEPEHLGICEVCSDVIMPGDLATCGGDDVIWLCAKHSATLMDQIKWYREMIESGDFDLGGFNDETELKNALDMAETEYLTTGNRSMATVCL